MYFPSSHLFTTMGLMIPCSRMELARSFSAFSSNVLRGWCGLGKMSETGISAGPVPRSSSSSSLRAFSYASSVSLNSAESPRPSPFTMVLFPLSFRLLQKFFGECRIRTRSHALGIVQQDGFSVTGRLGKAHVARNDDLIEFLGKILLDLRRDLLGDERPPVVHGQHDALHLEGLV